MTSGEKMRHPAGLYILFFTEMWERFSYYGMRALLVYYMIEKLSFSQPQSSSIYGLYTGFVYFTPFFGGIVADRWLGQRKTVIIGGVLMAIGHFLMAFQNLFYPALFFLIIGNGAFKPNISTQVGNLYEAGDHRRDRAYGIFYMGINLGALLSPLICGSLGESKQFGYHWGFSAAGVGMIIGLIIYILGSRYLAPDEIMKKAAVDIPKENQPVTREEYSRIGALIVLMLFTIVFWAVYEQQGNTLALWAKDNTNRDFFGYEIKASYFQSVNPLMIFLFIPVLNILWAKQAKRNREPSSIVKMGIGCILLGISFLLMIPPSMMIAGGDAKVSMFWLIACIFVLTIGEMYLSPIGLSLVTKLAPVRMVSMLMGVWFLASFFGNYLAGFIGTFWEAIGKEYFFILLAATAISAGAGILLLNNPLKRAIGAGSTEPVDI